VGTFEKRTWCNSPWTVVIGFPIFVFLAFALFVLRPGHSIHDRAITRACCSNLDHIQAAKTEWAKSEHKSTNDLPADDDLFGPGKHLREKPVCPGDGTYPLGPAGQKPRCSVPGHTI
jgi:hypothetical protein